MKTSRDALAGTANIEQWPLKEPFVLSRGSRTHAEVVYLRITDGVFFGHSECQPNKRYNETAEGVQAQLAGCFPASLEDLVRYSRSLPSYAARNALDCALWDYQLKRNPSEVTSILKPPDIGCVPTYFTLSVAKPDRMAEAAAAAYGAGCRRLKLKFAGEGDDVRLKAVRAVAVDASLIIDANEAWTDKMLLDYLPLLESLGVDLLEQPLPAGADSLLASINTSVVLCADESCHSTEDVPSLVGKYDAVNIKLDKAGGLTPSHELFDVASKADMKIMVGCMLGTSLAIAPAFSLAARADFVDLDAPLLLAEDRSPSFKVDESFVFRKAKSDVWG